MDKTLKEVYNKVMKTAKYLNNLLKTVFEKSGMSEDLEPIIEELRDNIAARDTQLAQHGTFAESEGEEMSFSPNAIEAVQGEDYKAKFEALEKRYIDRFFNGEEASVESVQPPTILEQGKPEEVPDLDDLIISEGE